MPFPNDRRMIHVILTDDGNELMNKITEKIIIKEELIGITSLPVSFFMVKSDKMDCSGELKINTGGNILKGF